MSVWFDPNECLVTLLGEMLEKDIPPCYYWLLAFSSLIILYALSPNIAFYCFFLTAFRLLAFQLIMMRTCKV